jgi:8-oxo-dGTP diphosphatase
MAKTVVAASVVVRDSSDRVLLIQRGHAPAEGLWSLPGGSVMPGETPEAAAVREAFEETGLVVTLGSELFVVTVELAPGVDYEIHGFSTTGFSGELAAGDDAADAQWVDWQTYATLQTTPRLTSILQSAGWPPAGASQV